MGRLHDLNFPEYLYKLTLYINLNRISFILNSHIGFNEYKFNFVERAFHAHFPIKIVLSKPNKIYGRAVYRTAS